MVRQALGPVAGVVLGVVAARWLRAFVEAQLFAVDARDPATLAGAVVTVVLAAMLAAYLPARDARRVDPVEVLRASQAWGGAPATTMAAIRWGGR